MKIKPWMYTLALWALLAGSALAQDVDYDVLELDTENASEQDIIDALTPPPPLLSRSMDGEAPEMKLRAIPLRIRFELDSYELTESAQQTLNRLGSALTSDSLSQFRFRVEGHTDALGDEDYNLDLSRRRADGVRNYLINLFEMEASRLETVARGESSLLNPDAPNSPDNRVVLIVNLGPEN